MSFLCSWPNCQTPASNITTCKRKKLYFCFDHLQKHNVLCSNIHKNVLIENTPTSDNILTIDAVENIIKWTKDITKKSKNDYNKIMLEIRSALKDTLSAIKKIKIHCKGIRSKLRKDSSLELPGTNLEEINIELKALLKNVFTDWKTVSFNTSEYVDDIENSFYSVLYSDYREGLDRYLDFFIKNTKTLVTFDIKLCNYTKKDIDMQGVQGNNISICRLSSNEIFIEGGLLLSEYLDSCYIIDTKLGKGKAMLNGQKRRAAQPLFFKNSIYIFGGQSYEIYLNDCNEFNLTSKIWRNLSRLNTGLSCTSPLPWKNNEILVVGSDLNGRRYLFSYNIIEDFYLYFNFDHSDKYHMNLLVRNDKFLLLLSANSLFVTEIGEFFEWKKVEHKYAYYGIISQVTIREKKAYFIDSNANVFSICLETYQMENLLKIE
ncbi:hypothetical protein SteCoe_2640 [Stentor coeruleus]|uniref:Uncharacterized protein n=1 Tax=Stentor coeruleus TaxID=5963 RepID=A0A1R2CZ77_9CILI|nr:hypothetical protein SteCoe_2640 [Stentor coeruleus]